MIKRLLQTPKQIGSVHYKARPLDPMTKQILPGQSMSFQDKARTPDPRKKNKKMNFDHFSKSEAGSQIPGQCSFYTIEEIVLSILKQSHRYLIFKHNFIVQISRWSAFNLRCFALFIQLICLDPNTMLSHPEDAQGCSIHICDLLECSSGPIYTELDIIQTVTRSWRTQSFKTRSLTNLVYQTFNYGRSPDEVPRQRHRMPGLFRQIQALSADR